MNHLFVEVLTRFGTARHYALPQVGVTLCGHVANHQLRYKGRRKLCGVCANIARANMGVDLTRIQKT